MDWYVFLVDDWYMLNNWVRLWHAFYHGNRFHRINMASQIMFSVSVRLEIMGSVQIQSVTAKSMAAAQIAKI